MHIEAAQESYATSERPYPLSVADLLSRSESQTQGIKRYPVTSNTALRPFCRDRAHTTLAAYGTRGALAALDPIAASGAASSQHSEQTAYFIASLTCIFS